jgi:cell wall-associated NlpC family hydrolase
VRGTALWMSMMLLAFTAVAVAPAAAQSPAPALAPASAPTPAPTPTPAPATGGAAYGVAFQPTVAGVVAQIVNGVAYAPDQAPDQVKQAVWAANQIVGMPYRLGGGHKLGFTDHAYDCSGTVSFALHGGGLLARPRDSSSFGRFGAAGKGQWITVYTNPGHAFAVIAGLRLDTSAAGDPAGGSGPRWRPNLRSTRSYRARHPVGL